MQRERPPYLRSAPPMELLPTPRPRRLHGWSAWAPVVLGPYLAASTILWPHARDALINSSLVGVLVFGIGAVALYVPWLGRVNVALAIWLGLSTFAIDHLLRVTPVHDAIVAIVILVASLIAPGRRRRRTAAA